MSSGASSNLTNKVALVTGAASAIGAAVATVVTHWDRLDILVNCAGIAFAKPITDLALADWRRVLGTNLDGVFLGTKVAMTAMRSTGGGCLINIASAAGIKPLAGNAAYGTTKAAIRYFTQIAGLEGKPHGIRVNSVSPGAVATPMWRATEMWPADAEAEGGAEVALDALVEKQGFARPEEVAAAVAYLVSDEARHITGMDLVIDDGSSIGWWYAADGSPKSALVTQARGSTRPASSSRGLRG